MDEKHSNDASGMLPQNILSQTSRHNDRDYRLPRTETHSSAASVQHSIKPVVHPSAATSSVPSSTFTVQPDHPPPKKSFDANGAPTLTKLPIPTSSIPAQKSDRKGESEFFNFFLNLGSLCYKLNVQISSVKAITLTKAISLCWCNLIVLAVSLVPNMSVYGYSYLFVA